MTALELIVLITLPMLFLGSEVLLNWIARKSRQSVPDREDR